MKTLELYVSQFEYPNCGCCFQCCVEKLPGVSEVETDLINMVGTIYYDPTIWPDVNQLIGKIKKLGFDAEPYQD